KKIKKKGGGRRFTALSGRAIVDEGLLRTEERSDTPTRLITAERTKRRGKTKRKSEHRRVDEKRKRAPKRRTHDTHRERGAFLRRTAPAQRRSIWSPSLRLDAGRKGGGDQRRKEARDTEKERDERGKEEERENKRQRGREARLETRVDQSRMRDDERVARSRR
ncbi:unnamed protein product, partial [Ixodes persulcatus]